MPVETAETLEDIVSAPVTCTIHGTTVEFGLYDQQWDDGSYIFCGYNTTNNPKITIAGQPVGLVAEIIPEGAPERTNPFLASLPEGQNTVVWYANALATLSAAFFFLREFEEKRGFLLDGTLNSETEKYYNYEDLQSQLDSFSQVMRNNTITFSRKVERLAPILTSIRRILEINRIPDNLKYEESTFYLNVLKLQEHVQWLIGETDKTDEDIIPDFRLIAEHLADVLTEIHDDHQSVARGREPFPTEEEKQAILQTLEELAAIQSLPKDSIKAMQQTGKKLELYQKIWSSPAVDWQTRLDAATRAVDIISDAISRMEAAAIESKKRHAILPDLSRYVDEINARIDELDTTGLAAITGPMADRFLPGINDARKTIGQDPLTKDTLARSIRLNSLLASVTENETGLTTTLHLYLTDGEYPRAMHYMYVMIASGRIQEMKLLGR
ncbi:hypothetical protein LJC19_06165 [Oxalobacter sp. OttesenSCG-928-P03]|nr:hypothetical protein [Oxalobacter sp. OttesenSCG-928-P03]